MDRAGLYAGLLSAVLMLGCGNGEVTGPDASDGDGGINNMFPDAGDDDVSSIEIELRTDPEIPAEDLEDPWDASLSKATFRLEDLRVVGDAATLERREFELEFTERQHIKLEFSPAAPGMYATFIGRIDHFRIEGTVDVGGSEQEFVIEDNPPPSTTFVVLLDNATVTAGETKKLRVDIDLEDFVNEIDWNQAEIDDGKLVPTEDMMDEIREEIADAFELH